MLRLIKRNSKEKVAKSSWKVLRNNVEYSCVQFGKTEMHLKMFTSVLWTLWDTFAAIPEILFEDTFCIAINAAGFPAEWQSPTRASSTKNVTPFLLTSFCGRHNPLSTLFYTPLHTLHSPQLLWSVEHFESTPVCYLPTTLWPHVDVVNEKKLSS